MMDCALYFPYIRVPQTPWFTQVLLYWDQAATIVPQSLDDDSAMTDEFTRELREVGLLRWMRPSQELRVEYEPFIQGFLSLLGGVQRPLNQSHEVRIHVDKMSSILFEELRKRGLASSFEWPWWSVERDAADLYMGYLASVISATNPGMAPVTDTSKSFSTLGDPRLSFAERLSALRYAVVAEALPAPKGPVAPSELARFKEKHTEALLRCRRFLDAKIVDLVRLEDIEEREIRLAAVSQEISDDVARLTEAMAKRRWPEVTFVGFGGVAAAGLELAQGVAAGGNALEFGLAAGAGIVSIGLASHGLWQLLREKTFDSRAPLAYAALSTMPTR